MALRVDADWPVLTTASWEPTRETVHMWTQIVGKIRLALEPMVNHWWQVPLYVTARGLTTSLMHAGDVGLEIEFDFVDHVLVMRTTRGETRNVRLKPQSVAHFFASTMLALRELGITVPMLARPVEVADAIPFADDLKHHSYDARHVNLFWRQLVHADRVLKKFRSRFTGKVSPVHFFWGGFDMAVTRFSGRPAPRHPGGAPNCADWVMEEAYSHEVSSCGFWPGGSEEGSFYAYAYPEPDGFSRWGVEPAEAFYDPALGDFLLPYAAVRQAPDPDATVLSFLQSTYEAAATLGNWDRASLERP
jgi:Family of unknown function (DUF5996)